MHFPWKRKKIVHLKEASIGPLNESQENPEAVAQDPPLETDTHSNQGKYMNWIDALIIEHEKQGGFDNLSGKGKPIHIDPNEDVFDGILKNAGAVPPWIDFQQEIRSDIQRTINSMRSKTNFDIESAITQINVKIRKFNTQCPTPLLQKKPVTSTNIVERLGDW